MALVAGTAGGIGRAAALRLAAAGARVLAADVNQEGLAETLVQLETRGGDARG